MKRRTIDIAFSVGGALFSVLLLVLGLVLKDQQDFAKGYVSRELSAQKIDFPKVEELKDGEEEKPCLVKYAGETMSTGQQAECFATDYIGLHMEHSAARLTISDGTNFEGATYESLGGYTMGILPGKVAEAQAALIAAVKDSSDTAVVDAYEAYNEAVANSVDPAVQAALEKVDSAEGDEAVAAARAALSKAAAGSWDRGIVAASGALTKAQASSSDQVVTDALMALDIANADLKAVSGLRSTLQTGETLRGLLLTTYGFSIFGDKAGLAATVCYLAAALIFLLSILGFLHAAFSKHAKDVVLAVEHH